jgi:hypothetical protein
MKIGDKLKCENGHMYTLGWRDDEYTFSIIDEEGNIVNAYMDYALNDCMPWYEEDQKSLRVNNDYTYITEFVEV